MRIATVRDSALRWLNIDTGDQIGPTVVSDASRGIAQFDISPDRKWLAVAGTDNDVRVIDALTGRLHGAPMKGHKGTVTQVGFSPDGNSLVSGSEDTTVRVWDWRTGRQVGDPMTGHDRGLKTVSFGKDGRRLYSTSSDSIRVWDTTTHQEVGKPIRGSYFTTSAVSPDGRRIATVESDATIQQWDAESGQPVGPQVPGHLRSTTDIEYNSDGRYLVSVGMDATLRFWDARTGDPTGHAGPCHNHARHPGRRAEQRRPARVRQCVALRRHGWRGHLGSAGACRVAGNALRKTGLEPDRSRMEAVGVLRP